MVMLTQMLRHKIADRSGRSARITDLCIDLLEDDYPPVTHIVFTHEGKLRLEAWSNVIDTDWKRGRVEITDLNDSKELNDADAHVFLVRDLMDALVLDLLGRRTTRVADLRLREEENVLRVVGADAGLAAMIRRVTRGRIGNIDKESLFDWKYVEFLRGDPSAVENGAGYRLRINRLPAGEIARLADYIPYLHAAELINLLPDDKAAEVLQAMPIERQHQVIDELPDDEAFGLLVRMAPDLATDLLGRLDLEVMRGYISRFPPDRRDKIVELLHYPENSVGGVMTNDIVRVAGGVSVGHAREKVIEQIQNSDFIALVFIVDEEPNGRLRGSISIREVLSTTPDKNLDDIMDPFVATLDPFSPAAEAAHRIVGNRLEAMPVVNAQGLLLGAMTISSAISQLVPASSSLSGVRVFS